MWYTPLMYMKWRQQIRPQSDPHTNKALCHWWALFGHKPGVLPYKKVTSSQCIVTASFQGTSFLDEVTWGCLNIKKASYQCRDFHYKDKTVSRPSYLYNGNPHLERPSFYWEGARSVKVLHNRLKPEILKKTCLNFQSALCLLMA